MRSSTRVCVALAISLALVLGGVACSVDKSPLALGGDGGAGDAGATGPGCPSYGSIRSLHLSSADACRVVATGKPAGPLGQMTAGPDCVALCGADAGVLCSVPPQYTATFESMNPSLLDVDAALCPFEPDGGTVDIGCIAATNAAAGEAGCPDWPGYGSGLTCPGGPPPTAAQLDDPLHGPGWQASVARPGACTAADLAVLASSLAAGSSATRYADYEKGLGPDCVSCLFTTIATNAPPDAAGAWQPFVVYQTNGTAAGQLSNAFGACLSSAVSPACGQAQFDEDVSPDVPCAACTDQSTFDVCVQEMLPACHAKLGPNTASKCGPGYAAAYSACAGASSKTDSDKLVNIARLLCGPTASDGGDGG